MELVRSGHRTLMEYLPFLSISTKMFAAPNFCQDVGEVEIVQLELDIPHELMSSFEGVD